MIFSSFNSNFSLQKSNKNSFKILNFFREKNPYHYLPILRFNFGNQKINEDILGFLFFSLNHSNTNNSEKIKCRANLKLIFEQILGFKIKPLEFDESKLHKQELMTIAKKLEKQLFTRVFSYFPPMSQEEVKNYLKFTCKNILQKKLDEKLD